jgi:hypothetical protein
MAAICFAVAANGFRQSVQIGRSPCSSIRNIRCFYFPSSVSGAWCFAPPTLRWLPRRKSWREAPMLTKPEVATEKPKAGKKAKPGAQSAKGAPAKSKATKKAPAPKNAPKGKKGAKAQETAGPREGSKTAQVVAMLQRAKGANISEIMDKMGWQRHTVRGFMAGAMKKAGFTVESFKPEGVSAAIDCRSSLALPPLARPALRRRAFLLLAAIPGGWAHTSSRRRTNARAPNVRDRWPILGWLAVAVVPPTSRPARGTAPANRDARPGSGLRWLRSRAGNGRFKRPPGDVPGRSRRTCVRRFSAAAPYPVGNFQVFPSRKTPWLLDDPNRLARAMGALAQSLVGRHQINPARSPVL